MFQLGMYTWQWNKQYHVLTCFLCTLYCRPISVVGTFLREAISTPKLTVMTTKAMVNHTTDMVFGISGIGSCFFCGVVFSWRVLFLWQVQIPSYCLRRVSFYLCRTVPEHTAQIPLRYVGIHNRQFLIDRLRDCIRVLIIYVGIVKSTYHLNDSCTKSQLNLLYFAKAAERLPRAPQNHNTHL